jgi:hypothetical protein
MVEAAGSTLNVSHVDTENRHFLGCTPMENADEEAETTNAKAGEIPKTNDVMLPRRGEEITQTRELWSTLIIDETAKNTDKGPEQGQAGVVMYSRVKTTPSHGDS